MCANGAVVYTTLQRCGRKKEICLSECGRDRPRAISVNAIAVALDTKKIEHHRAHACSQRLAQCRRSVQTRMRAHDAARLARFRHDEAARPRRGAIRARRNIVERRRRNRRRRGVNGDRSARRAHGGRYAVEVFGSFATMSEVDRTGVRARGDRAVRIVVRSACERDPSGSFADAFVLHDAFRSVSRRGRAVTAGSCPVASATSLTIGAGARMHKRAIPATPAIDSPRMRSPEIGGGPMARTPSRDAGRWHRTASPSRRFPSARQPLRAA